MSTYSLEQLTGLTQTHLTTVTVGEKTFLIHHQIKDALIALIKDAQVNGFDFAIASGFRDYHRQALIWNAKFNGERAILDSNSQPLDASRLNELEKIHAILRWSALPGGSRHHWGCELDVYARNLLPAESSLQLEPWEYETGHQKAFNQWLTDALPKFGFFRPYKCDRGGVAIEPWHISHHQTSQLMLEQLSVEALRQVWNQYPFQGSEFVSMYAEDLYHRYISNISPI